MPEDLQPPTNTIGEAATRSMTAPVPPSLDRYRLIERLGEGGMGEVWVAEQEAPVRRRVAIKLVHAGTSSARVVARFESERQALALMNHPNIAHVFDAGTTADGRPFFAMELVEGEPVTAYCDRHRLTVGDRLALFMQICEGVQHAHQKGIIHRDIKPSNVLVTIEGGSPTCKIIDFGVAKAIETPLSEDPLLTRAGALVGTPAYMSPEQADRSGTDLDTRTDVYSLGVLLYETLTGVLPFDPKDRGGGADEIRRRLREEEPPRPSRRIVAFDAARTSDLLLTRQTDLGQLQRRLAGDLDWIVMKAMEKDRARRYGSPDALADDVRRSLRDEPVSATPPTVGYRVHKFVRRHRFGVAVTAVVAVALFAGLALALWGLVQARRSEVVARREAEAAEQTTAFLVDLFQVSTPDRAKGHAITAREILDKGAGEIRTRLEGQPLLQARMMGTIGMVYDRLALYDEARPLLEESLATQRRLLGDENADTLQSMSELARLDIHSGRYDGVEDTLRRILATRRRLEGDDSPRTLDATGQLGAFLFERGRLAEAEPLLRFNVEARRRAPGGGTEVYVSMLNYASLLQDLGRGAEAEALYREAEQGFMRISGADDTQRLRTLNDLATLLVSQDKLAEAESTFRDLLVAERRIYGPDHPETLTALNNLGVVVSMEGKLDEAEPLYREALERRRRLLGDDHPDTLFSIHNMGGLLVDLGRLEEGERFRREAWERRTRVLGPDHPDTLEAASNLALVLSRLGRLPEAERRYREAVEGRRRLFGLEHEDTLMSLSGLAGVLQKTGRIDEATNARREVLAGLRATRPEGDFLIGVAMSRLGDCLAASGPGQEAEAMLTGGFAIIDRQESAPPALRKDALERIVSYYEKAGRADLAASWRARLQ